MGWVIHLPKLFHARCPNTLEVHLTPPETKQPTVRWEFWGRSGWVGSVESVKSCKWWSYNLFIHWGVKRVMEHFVPDVT
eukprot:5104783-Amphidinium_carterae.1